MKVATHAQCLCSRKLAAVKAEEECVVLSCRAAAHIYIYYLLLSCRRVSNLLLCATWALPTVVWCG